MMIQYLWGKEDVVNDADVDVEKLIILEETPAAIYPVIYDLLRR